MERSTLALVQTITAVLVVLGAVAVVAGHQAQAGYDCESGYAYDPSPVSADEVDGQPVAFENLSDAQQEAFLAGLGDETVRVSEQPPSVVVYNGEHYEVHAMAFDCGDPPGVLLFIAGVPMLVVGALGFLPSFAVLRLRDWD